MALSKLSAFKSLTEFEREYPTEIDLITDLMNAKLLHSTMTCTKCGRTMSLRRRNDSQEWRCRNDKKSDCSSKSIKAGSWFQNSNLTLKKCFALIICWSNQFAGNRIEEELRVSANTICDWKNMLREICERIVKKYPKIGGEGMVVEIDESAVHSRKYGRGAQRGEPIWIVGGIVRGTREIFVEKAPNRSAKVLIPLLKRNIHSSSTVVSDKWAAYNQLSSSFKRHECVNHSIEFKTVATDGLEVCTNSIESAWKRMKEPLKRGNGTSDELLDSYLNEFMVRERSGDQFLKNVLLEILV